MRIIVSGGGTGGHIYPAISIIQELKKRDPDNKILYVGEVDGMEKEIAKKYSIDYEGIRVKGMPRKINGQIFIFLKELFFGLRQSKKILKNFKPDVIIGTGGFVSGPILYKGSKTEAFTMIHEQNIYPGVANRILSKYVDKIAITYEESKKYFKNPERTVLTGNPIRDDFELCDRESVYKKFSLDKNKKTILVFGGSFGSKKINDVMPEIIKKINGSNEIQLIHVTGKYFYKEFCEKIKEIKLKENIKIFEYMDDIPSAYSITDLIITSSGAITLSEISYIGIASILIPKSYTTGNHQEKNAKLYEDAKASVMIRESELNENILYDKINEIVYNNKMIDSMKNKSITLGKKDAKKLIVDIVYNNVGDNI